MIGDGGDIGCPSVPGVVPLPGFTGPIGIAGPLVPPPTPPPSPPSTAPVMVSPMTSRMFPSMFPLFAPMSLPSQVAPSPMLQPMFQQSSTFQSMFPQPSTFQSMFPQSSTFQSMFPQSSTFQSMFPQSSTSQSMFPQPSVPQSMFPQSSAPQLMFPQPTVSQTIFPQATVSQLMFPQRTVSQAMFPQPTVSQPMSPPSPIMQPTFLTFQTFPASPTPPSTPSLPSFIPPILPSLPIPLDGPLLPPLPMNIPATFIPGPPPIFGAPWFGPFDEPSGSAGASLGSMGTPSALFSGSFGQPFGFKPSFGHPFGFDLGFGSGFPSSSNFYSGLSQSFPFSNGYNRGSKNGNKKDFDDDDEDDDDDTYDDEKSSASNDDDSDKSKPSKRSKNNNIAKRKKREYDSNDHQDVTNDHQDVTNDHQDVTNEQQSSSESINQSLDQSSPCIGQTIKTNIPHPTDSTKYISCLNENKYEIMDCPTDFIYNALIDQCEKNKNMESICEQQQPCMNDGQCYQTSSTTYKCVCRGAWTGEHCETPLSPCASNPCGEGNECHTLITNDYKQDYICICNQQQSYGLTCAQNTIPNPCMSASNDEEQYYPFAFSVSAYIQCDGDLLHVRPCSTGLHWNQEKQICDREETLSMDPIEDQSQSYHINYNTQPSETTFNRPYVNFIDQIVDKQQGYRYRNYDPHTTSNDFRYNQIHLPEETSMMYSYFPSLSMIKENRRLKNQQGYTPINMHVMVEDQKPMFSDQQFSQSYNQLPKNSFMQLTPRRNMYHVFQSSSYRR
ncbi:unnamed protein product [Rotaria sordida]|uniref:Uncharacterized protein n=2 Tax=Rotaria sordida TaxID=392033 RepID=A0A815A5G2_9BILA|nr:unnamed protein product [Rotaria sordida]